ncbi:MAG: acyltransferase [Bacteroidales bacterium]|nr:acyltransferase [Bacteroidales bacterium]
MDALLNEVFSISTGKDFEAAALKIFRYQAEHNPLYSLWIKELGVDPEKVLRLSSIPFMPVSFFRDRKIITGSHEAEKVFVSSGTTGMRRSRHYIAELSVYERSLSDCFNIFYGDPAAYVIMALLPSYLEQGESSLVYMAERLITLSGSDHSGFFIYDYDLLKEGIERLRDADRKILLLGVSYALLDFAEYAAVSMKGHIVMETGGMKGRRREMTREELHDSLKEGFDTDSIHSEYGMTELLSQAYSAGDGMYYSPPWMKVLIRDPHDPFSFLPHGRTGAVIIIDLANIHSCSFIETSDLGLSYPDGSFRISGRFDNSDIRGCNLLAV